eukprot:4854078-Prymnesium_polylepis.1
MPPSAAASAVPRTPTFHRLRLVLTARLPYRAVPLARARVRPLPFCGSRAGRRGIDARGMVVLCLTEPLDEADASKMLRNVALPL